MQKSGCDLIGYSEGDVDSLFGKPNGKFFLDNDEVWRYQLTDFGYISFPGQEYLDLHLNVNGEVNQARFWKVDG